MKKLNFNFVGNWKKFVIASAAIFVVGAIVWAILGVDLDINFRGGSRFTYSYSGDINVEKVEEVAEKVLDEKVSVSTAEAAVSEEGKDDKTIIITVPGVAVDLGDTKADEKAEEAAEEVGVQGELKKALDKELKTEFTTQESNVVEASIASNFFVKSLVAVALAGILVVVYIGFRFRNIGGLSASLFALLALVHDVIIAFLACVFFRLEIDMNFLAVVLTIFGYSLNDTIVIYDRIRENRKKSRQTPIAVVTNGSINQTLGRTIVTSLTTFISVVVVGVVAEFFGLTSLRTFAIPMALGLISGAYSSVCLACPLWVKWQERAEARKAAKAADYTRRK